MAYISVPNSFVSGQTFYASAANNNFGYIVTGLSSGSKDINIHKLECVSATAEGTSNIDTSCYVGGNIEIASNVTINTLPVFSENVTISELNINTYESMTISSNTIIPTQSYIKLKTDSDTELYTITTTNFQTGDLLIITKDPSSAANPKLVSGTGNLILSNNLRLNEEAIIGYNMVLSNTDTTNRVLTNNTDKIVLQLFSSNWIEVKSFGDNVE